MILESGNNILIAHRRMFEGDLSRYFIGVVDGYEAGIVRATGYSWSVDCLRGEMCKKSDWRTKILSIASGTLIVYQLPQQLDIAKVDIQHKKHGSTLLTDGSDFSMDLSDRISSHPQ